MDSEMIPVHNTVNGRNHQPTIYHLPSSTFPFGIFLDRWGCIGWLPHENHVVFSAPVTVHALSEVELHSQVMHRFRMTLGQIISQTFFLWGFPVFPL